MVLSPEIEEYECAMKRNSSEGVYKDAEYKVALAIFTSLGNSLPRPQLQ